MVEAGAVDGRASAGPGSASVRTAGRGSPMRGASHVFR